MIVGGLVYAFVIYESASTRDTRLAVAAGEVFDAVTEEAGGEWRPHYDPPYRPPGPLSLHCSRAECPDTPFDGSRSTRLRGDRLAEHVDLFERLMASAERRGATVECSWWNETSTPQFPVYYQGAATMSGPGDLQWVIWAGQSPETVSYLLTTTLLHDGGYAPNGPCRE